MQTRVNPHQLVLRLDSATGLARVGWAADLPIGRFRHVELVTETPQCGPISPGDPLFEAFTQACQRARQINLPLVNAQAHSLLANGYLPVPLDLNAPDAVTCPDAFGSFHEAAMAALFRLTANVASVWAVVEQQTVVQLHSCKPPRQMEELEYQVWKRFILNQFDEYPGDILAGKLIVRESGLWFYPDE
jgi:hypothetical protein